MNQVLDDIKELLILLDIIYKTVAMFFKGPQARDKYSNFQYLQAKLYNVETNHI